jgi:protein-disulfide isomerase
VSETYPNNVKVVFKQFPLRMHKFAFPAARASIAARNQGKFWELHDKLFDNSKALSDEKIRELAQEAGLNMDEFDKDMKDPATEKEIQQDMAMGQQAGVRGVPAVFINGKSFKRRDLASFKREIDKELKEASK